MPSLNVLIVASCALVLAAVSPTAAKSGPKTGTYKATGDIEFRFTVTRMNVAYRRASWSRAVA